MTSNKNSKNYFQNDTDVTIRSPSNNLETFQGKRSSYIPSILFKKNCCGLSDCFSGFWCQVPQNTLFRINTQDVRKHFSQGRLNNNKSY